MEKKRSLFFGISQIKRLAFTILLGILLSLPAYAQSTNKISGVIHDASGNPVIGASVIMKDKKTGVITDIDGKFTIDAANGTKLVISYIGYQTKELTVGKDNFKQIILAEDIEQLDELVVVGYGTQKKATLTGAVSAVTNKEITTTKNENVMNMLTGKVPGVRVVQKSAEPGSFNNSFDIRGLGNPLVIIDGIPRDNFTRMDPNEIESISVLKDASAAIYGVRAANGVVLITTKKGNSAKKDKFDMTYSVNYGGQKAIGLPLGTDAIGYMTLMNEKRKRNFQNNYITQLAPAFNEADFEAFRNGSRISSDWGKLVLADFAPQQQHSLSMNGSGENINYFFNVGYLDQMGIFKSGDLNYNKWNFRANIDAKITKNVRTELRVSGIMDTKNDIVGGAWNVFKSIWNQLPTDAIYANNNHDYPGTASGFIHPALAIDADETGYNQTKGKWLQSSFALIYDIPHVKGLNAKALYSYDYKNSDNKQYSKAVTQYTYDPANNTYIGSVLNSPSKVSRSYGMNTSQLLQLSLNYERSFKSNNVKGLLLFENNVSEGDNFYASRELALDIDQLYAGNDKNQIGNMDANGLYKTVSKSLIGRVNYDYASKYLAEFSFRRDGSSRFSPIGQWGFFPAASAGWRISEESFIKDTKALSFINNLKLRTSYGVMGDDAALAYQFITGYDYPSGGTVFGGNYVNGVGFRDVANENLTWYTAKTFDVGVDLDLWQGLLGLQVDYFQRNREGLLATRLQSLPGTLGATLPQENLNGDQTLGYEIVLSHKNRIGKLNYNISGNMSITRTMMKFIEQAKAGNSYENWRNNQSDRYTNIWWGLTYKGQYQSYNEIYNNSVNAGGGNQGLVPGDYYYEDLNGDGVIDGWDERPIATRSTPQINFGFNLNADYRGFDLNLLFQGAAMVYVEYQEQLAEPLCWDRNALALFMDRWHTEDPNADYFDPNTKWIPGTFASVGNGSVRGSGTAAVQDASYIRLKSAELGYTVPRKLMQKIGLDSGRFYVNGYNLLTFTGLKFIDPEHPGDELYGYIYPLAKTYNIGFNVTF
jgi:TonB-linked SusC/RagA family outer membrane protein